jgi:hypothetical protein
MLPFVPYIGATVAALTLFLWVRDRLKETHETVKKIATNDLPHLQESMEKLNSTVESQTHAIVGAIDRQSDRLDAAFTTLANR